MPNTIDQTGLQTKTREEIINEFLNGAGGFPGLYGIYGPDINVGPNSPDGQLLNILAQVAVDMEELIASVNAAFDPDQATGTILDARCAINGVIRQGATYTMQSVNVTVSQALTLPGLDTSNPFTVADSNGNQFQLATSYAFAGAGTVALVFRAALVGPVLTTIGTITNVITPQTGVSGVNNSIAANPVGVAQESDASLRIRRAASVSLPSKGFLQGLLGALVDIEGVVQAIVLENITNATDANGIPGHSIWVIVDAPSSANAEIGEAIYVKRNAGCGMTSTGTGATAGVATVAAGAVTAIAVGAAGTGYTVAPTVVIGGPGAGAAAHATIAGGIVTGIVVDAGGAGYLTPPVVTLIDHTNVVQVPQVDGTNFAVLFDNPIRVPLFINLTIAAVTGSYDATFIRNQLLALLSYKIGQIADVTTIVALVHQIAPNVVVSNEGVSLTNAGYAITLAPASVNRLFVPASTTIYINGAPGP